MDFQEFSEDPEWAFRANEVKKEFNRNRPKVYRNGTGKRWSKRKDKLPAIYSVECDEQVMAEEENELPV